MAEPTDHELLAEFARTGAETAFAALVRRHVNLVYSTALRFTSDAHLAEEIAQAVFIILARKAGGISPRAVLSGWLYQTARLTAANAVKQNLRRQQREQEAYMQSTLTPPETDDAWKQIAPLLDDVMGGLSERDRNAVVLRFFENQTLAQVGAALGVSEDGARVRVNRALEKLRAKLYKQGVMLAGTLIAGAVTTNSVQAAPVALVKTISVIAVAKGAVATASTLTLVKGALKLMAWTKMKIAVVAGVSVLLVTGTATVIMVSKKNAPLPPIQSLPNPNGYDDLVKAGGMVSSNSWNYDKATLEQLRDTTVANAEALALARSALSNECRVPLQFTQFYITNHISAMIRFRSLTYAFVTQGKLAEMENLYSEAANSYLDAIHLGVEVGHGGILVDAMMGTAVESVGVEQMQRIVDNIDPKSYREICEALEKLDSQNQVWIAILQQDHDWSRRTYTGIRYDIMRFMQRDKTNSNLQKAEQTLQNHQLKMRQLMIDLAARAYALDKSHPPANLTDLVPDYLKTVPQDPFTGTNMVYLPQ